MRKGPGSVYNKWNISVVICDIFHNGQLNHGCNRKTFDVICNLSKEVLDLFNFIYFLKF